MPKQPPPPKPKAPPKPIVAQEQFVDLEFPLQGLDVSSGFGEQRPGTAPVAVNVRAFEPGTFRARGGARPGLSQYVPAQPAGLSAIQHLAVIVDPQEDALNAPGGNDVPEDPDSIDDPSTNNLKTRNPSYGSVKRRVRRKGSGGQPNINLPKPVLTVTANDQSKEFDDLAHSFDGTEFTTSGLQGGDSVTSVGENCDVQGRIFPPGVYPISPVPATVTGTTFGGQAITKKYKIKPVNGNYTVLNGFTFVNQGDGGGVVSGTGAYTLGVTGVRSNDGTGLHGVVKGDLIVFNLTTIYSQATSFGALPSFSATVTDNLGNLYTQIEGFVEVAETVSTTNFLTSVSLWYCVSAATGLLTLSGTFTPSTVGTGSLVVVTGEAAVYAPSSAPTLDGSATNFGSIGAGETTGTINVSGNRNVAFGAINPGVGVGTYRTNRLSGSTSYTASPSSSPGHSYVAIGASFKTT